jgi:hypothetical protein
MDAFLVPQPTDTHADTDSDATERAGNDAELDEDCDAAEGAHGDPETDDALDEDCDATEHASGDPSGATTEPPTKKQRRRSTVVSDGQPGDATERADYPEDDCDEAFPPVITSADAAATIADATGKKQMFTKSLAHRDDWLHRGIMLRDMDYYHYARYVERVEMPRSGSAQSFQKRHGAYYLFDRHYPLAKSYVQILRTHARTVQNVGPQCKRSDVNGGEDNAVYKAYFHSCVHPCIKHTSTSLSVQITVESSVSGEQIFGPLRIQRTQKTSSLLRQLQHIDYTQHQSARLIRLTFDDCILDPSRPVMQYHAATEHMGLEPEPKVEFKMIAEPLLLTWEQLLAMPAMRKRAGRGGKAACLKQRELRAFCLKNSIDEVDLARSAYDWRLLLKTMPCLNTPDVIGPGIVGFSFRLLSEIDPNYAAERHVFELNCANGDRWHLHFHQRGNCDRRHLPFDATQP